MTNNESEPLLSPKSSLSNVEEEAATGGDIITIVLCVPYSTSRLIIVKLEQHVGVLLKLFSRDLHMLFLYRGIVLNNMCTFLSYQITNHSPIIAFKNTYEITLFRTLLKSSREIFYIKETNVIASNSNLKANFQPLDKELFQNSISNPSDKNKCNESSDKSNNSDNNSNNNNIIYNDANINKNIIINKNNDFNENVNTCENQNSTANIEDLLNSIRNRPSQPPVGQVNQRLADIFVEKRELRRFHINEMIRNHYKDVRVIDPKKYVPNLQGSSSPQEKPLTITFLDTNKSYIPHYSVG